MIVLITAAGGAFGAMLRFAGVQETVRGLFGDSGATGIAVLLAGFGVATVIQAAHDSGMVAMSTSMPSFLRYTGHARPEERALLRSNPSAVSGSKAKLGGIAPPDFHLPNPYISSTDFGENPKRESNRSKQKRI